MIKNVWAVYWSPCGGTEKVTKTIAGATADSLKTGEVKVYDWTLPAAREKALTFTEEDLIVLGTPVYAGRVPNKAMPYIRDMITADGAMAVPVVCYGNRAYTDALMESGLLLMANGFKLLGGAAVVTQHVMNKNLAAGRPTTQEFADLAAFGVKLADKAAAIAEGRLAYTPAQLPGNNPVGPYYKPLEADGVTPANFMKAKPVLHAELCTKCGICAAVCPMGSISAEDPAIVTGICVKCHACINKCPTGTRYFDNASLTSHIRYVYEHNVDNVFDIVYCI